VWRDTDTLFAHVLRVNPSSLAAHKVFTFALEREGKFSESLEHAESALRLTPGDVQLNFHVGNLLAFRLGRPQEALAYYERALDGWPANPKIHNNAGVALLHTGRAAEAARQFERALRLDPRYPDPHVNLGLLAAESGDLAAADAHFRAALALHPDLEPARSGLARVRELRDGARHE
jgi:Tfp pilus assembly protein PilF